MEQFFGRVAVITGASLGLGRSLAWKCAGLGMKVVMVSSNRERIEQAASELRAAFPAVEALPVQADVAQAGDLEALARQTWNAFGGAHLVVNNAGVCLMGSPLDNTLEEWNWQMGINFGGVLNSIRAFVPRMLASGEEGHIVTVASTSGLTAGSSISAYHASKHAAFALTESLYYTLREQNARIGVSIVAPGFIRTSIAEVDRNRPPQLGPAGRKPHQEAYRARFTEKVAGGMDPERVVEITFEGIRQGQLYIITHPENNAAIRRRFENILAQRNPA